VERAVLAKIIISYRRKDTDVFAGRVRDRMAARYGDDSVFIDVDDMPFGKDFRVHIQEVMAKADAVLVIIGPRWLGVGKSGHSRIKDIADPVRIELETALSNRTPTIPILVGRTNMPKPEQLPESLRDFAFINAAPVDTGRDFHRDLDRVMATIDTIIGVPAKVGAQHATDVAEDSSGSDPLPIQEAAAIKPQASAESAGRSDENRNRSQLASVHAPPRVVAAGRRRSWMPSAVATVGGFFVVSAALWFLLPRLEIAAPPATLQGANGQTSGGTFTPQPTASASTPAAAATSPDIAISDPAAKVVRDFYAALARGDGAAAAALVIPEKRKGNLDPQAMTDFFSNSYQPLQLSELVPAGQNTYQVRYTFKKSARSGDCAFYGTVSVTQHGGEYLIQATNIRHDC
jgi:hypothetical protein